MKIHAIITARGGSKGLLRKNIRLLAGKPLIAYSILAAKQCSLIERCIVTTEDKEIKNIALEWGAEVIDRPMALATDVSLSCDVVAHVLDILKEQGDCPDCFALLQPTSPLRTSEHLRMSIEKLIETEANSIISVTETEHHPYKAFVLDQSFLKPLFDQSFLDKPRQQFPKIFRQNGAIYVVKTDAFLKEKSFAIPPVLPFQMNSQESIDIDSLHDFEMAEQIIFAYSKADLNEK